MSMPVRSRLRCTSVQAVARPSKKACFVSPPYSQESCLTLSVVDQTISGHATWNDFSFVPIGELPRHRMPSIRLT